jgi:hypothetical protein
MLEGKVAQILHRHARRVAHHGRSDHVLAEGCVRHRECGGVDDSGMAHQRCVDRGRRHLETAAIDELLHATDDEEAPVFVDVA